MMKNKKIYDVIVIGAGFSGLAAALKLKEKNFDVLILEADDDYGGRSFNRYLDDGTVIELGGQWIGFHHDKALALIEKYQITKYTTPIFPEGKFLYEYGGKIVTEFPEEVLRLGRKFSELAAELNLEAPWMHPNAKLWDIMTFESWVEMQTASDDAKALIKRIIGGALLSRDSKYISMLNTMIYVASNKGFEIAVGAQGGAQHYRLFGGSYQLVKEMVKELQEKNTELLLDEPVSKIDYSKDVTVVTTMNNNSYQSKNVIIAVPPVIASRIIYQPSLPSGYYGLLQNFSGGDAFKIHFVYEKSFWIEKNLSGWAVKQNGYLTEIVDNTIPGNKHGILTAFIYGNKKREIMQKSPEERKLILIEELVDLFGKEARAVINFIEYDWLSAPWSGGCFVGNLGFGCWTAYGSYLRKPIASLHWASTEISPYFNGFFEGAILSGERAALEIIDKLR